MNNIKIFYLGWVILVTIYLIIRYYYLKSVKLTKEQFILKLNSLGYTTSDTLIDEVSLKVKNINNELLKKYNEGYNNANCTYCNFQIKRRSSCLYNCKNNSGYSYKQSYYNSLSENDKLLIKYYNLYTININTKLLTEAFIGYGIPVAIGITTIIFISDSRYVW